MNLVELTFIGSPSDIARIFKKLDLNNNRVIIASVIDELTIYKTISYNFKNSLEHELEHLDLYKLCLKYNLKFKIVLEDISSNTCEEIEMDYYNSLVHNIYDIEILICDNCNNCNSYKKSDLSDKNFIPFCDSCFNIISHKSRNY